MRKIAIISVFLSLLAGLKAQDKIITTHRDTIRCTILSINNECIVYEQKNNDGSSTGRFIILSEVAEYNRSAQSKNNLKQFSPAKTKPVKQPDNLWCVGVNSGVSSMSWIFENLKSSTPLPDYYNKIKNGFHVNASAHYMVEKGFGFGLEYSFFSTKYNGFIQSEDNSSIYITYPVKNRQYVNYLGPSALFQQRPGVNKKFILNESVSAGTLFYRWEEQSTYPYITQNEYTETTYNSLVTSNILAGKLGLTAEYQLLRNMSVGLSGDFLYGLVRHVDNETRGSGNYSSISKNEKLAKAINISRIDYSFIVRFHF